MSDGGTITARLGLDASQWRQSATGAASDVRKLTSEVVEGRAAVRAYEQALRAAGGGSATQLAQLKAEQVELSKKTVALKRAERAQKEYNAAAAQSSGPRAVSVPNAPRAQFPASAFRDSQAAKGSSSPNADDHGEGGGNTRSSGQEAAHSVRAIADSLAAGANPAQALKMELPRLLQAAGVGIGGMIAVEIAAALASSISTALQQKSVERYEHAQDLSGGQNAGDRYRTEGSARSQIDNLAARNQEILDDSGNGAPGHDKNFFQFAGHHAMNALRWATGQKSGEDQEADKMSENDAARIRLSGELARRKAEEVELDKKSFEQGDRATALDRVKLSIQQQLREVQSDPNMDGTAAARMVDSLRQQGQLLERIKQIEIDRENNARARAVTDSTGDHPGLTDKSGVATQLVDVNPQRAAANRSLRHALNARDEVAANLQSVKDNRGDTAKAQQALNEAEGSVRDLAVQEELKTPEERQQETNQEVRRKQAEQRVWSRTHPYDGSTAAKDSQGTESKIPYAGSGDTSAHSSSENVDVPDNASIPDNADIPDNASPSFQDLLNQNNTDYLNQMPAPDINQASDAGNDNSDIVAAINAQTQAIITATTATV